MTPGKPSKPGAVLVLIGAAGVFLFFYRMYQKDMKALKGFIAAYERFEEAMPTAADEFLRAGLGPAEEALAELQARASFRLSSLIKNEDQLMGQAREVADLARRELDALRVRREAHTGATSAGQAEALELDQSSRLLREQMAAAFSRFIEMGRASGRDRRSKRGGAGHDPRYPDP